MISTLYVLGCATLLPHQDLSAFPTGPEIELPKPDIGLLSPTLRRGLSDVTRLFMHTAKAALAQAEVALDRVHVVFASAFGEIAAAEKLIEQAFDENSSSPARFRQSVHNTAAGLFSISAKSVLPSTAIAAGWDTVAMGLLESSALLSEGGAEYVLLVFAEERVPPALSHEHEHGPLAVALVLSLQANPSALGRISRLRRASPRPDDQPFAGKNHPLGPAVSLNRALHERRAVTLAVGEGEHPYCVDVAPGAEP